MDVWADAGLKARGQTVKQRYGIMDYEIVDVFGRPLICIALCHGAFARNVALAL